MRTFRHFDRFWMSREKIPFSKSIWNSSRLKDFGSIWGSRMISKHLSAYYKFFYQLPCRANENLNFIESNKELQEFMPEMVSARPFRSDQGGDQSLHKTPMQSSDTRVPNPYEPKKSPVGHLPSHVRRKPILLQIAGRCARNWCIFKLCKRCAYIFGDLLAEKNGRRL